MKGSTDDMLWAGSSAVFAEDVKESGMGRSPRIACTQHTAECKCLCSPGTHRRVCFGASCVASHTRASQLEQPRWEMNVAPGARTLHLSYHDGEHYNSVRNIDDNGFDAPTKIVIRAPGAVQPAAGSVS